LHSDSYVTVAARTRGHCDGIDQFATNPLMNSGMFAIPRTRTSTIREGDVMISEPRKMVLTSLIVGVVGIAAYIAQADKRWLSADEAGLERDNAPALDTRGDTITGSVSTGAVVVSSDSAASIAGNLEAARHSLQRNDLAAAQAQLDAVRPTYRSDDRVLALQREVAAREQQAQAVVQVERPARQRAKPTRSSSPSSVNTVRHHENHFVAREHANRAPSSYAKTRRTAETAVAADSADSSSSGAASGPGAPATAHSSPSVAAEAAEVSNVTSAPADPAPRPPVPTAPSVPQAGLTAQTAAWGPQLAPAAGTSANSEGGAKTRAQVRSEIARARADGALPAFGNPDPAGPGGAPSLTVAPRP
jgi:predicted RecA/RadA family phage recombinase